MKVNKISISVSAHSEKGTRPINEDFYMFEKNGAGQLLAVVCDGIGGDDDSQVASKAVTSQFRDEFLAKKKITNFVRFYNKILTTSTKIINKKTLKGSKMGTTVCALLITGTTVEIANIGDSRIYYYSYQNNS
jgi:protein phosphatase